MLVLLFLVVVVVVLFLVLLWLFLLWLWLFMLFSVSLAAAYPASDRPGRDGISPPATAGATFHGLHIPAVTVEAGPHGIAMPEHRDAAEG